MLGALRGQLLARIGHIAQGLVVGEHGGAGARVELLVRRIHIAQAAGVAVAVDDVVPRGGGAGAVGQRRVQVDVGHGPGRPLQALGGLRQKCRRVLHHARRHKHGQRHHAARRLPALHIAAVVVEGIHLHAPAGFGNAQHAGAGLQLALRLERGGQLLGEPAVALGPGQHAFAVFGHGFARCMKAVAAGKVMQPGPGRHAGHAGAVVVAAAVVQVPAQVRVVQALLLQPRFKSHSIQRLMGGRQACFCIQSGKLRHGEAGSAAGSAHGLRKAAVLLQRGFAHALHGQQAFLPLALKVQALLRAVAQVAFVVLPAPGHALAQAQFFQQVLHLGRVVARHGQVVRAQRAGHAIHRTGPAVAAGGVFQLQQGKVVHPGQAQAARRRQPGHAAARDDDLGAPHQRGRGQRPLGQQVAQRVAALQVDARKGEFERRWWWLAASQQCGSSAAQKVAPLHRHSAHRARISSNCGSSGANSATRAGSKCLPAWAAMWSSASCTGQGSL